MVNWFNIEFQLLKQLKISPLELDQLEFYRVEYLIDNLKAHNKEVVKANREEEKKQRLQTPAAPKMPKIPTSGSLTGLMSSLK